MEGTKGAAGRDPALVNEALGYDLRVYDRNGRLAGVPGRLIYVEVKVGLISEKKKGRSKDVAVSVIDWRGFDRHDRVRCKICHKWEEMFVCVGPIMS